MKIFILATLLLATLTLRAQTDSYVCIPKAILDQQVLESLYSNNDLSDTSYLYNISTLIVSGINCESCASLDFKCVAICSVDNSQITVSSTKKKGTFSGILTASDGEKANLICEIDSQVFPLPSFGGSN